MSFKKRIADCCLLIVTVTLLSNASAGAEPAVAFPELAKRFLELPRDARRLTGPLFWLHGDESPERLRAYLDKVVEGGNGCFTAESRPHSDWLGPRWYRDLDICLQKAKAVDLQMWIFDERWWPSQSIGGTVPARYAAKTLVAESLDVAGPTLVEAGGYGGERYIAAVAGRLNEAKEIEGESLLDLAPFVTAGKLRWQAPAGSWQVIKFTHEQAPGLGQRGGKELSIDGASRDCTDWFLKTVYLPHYEHFKDDFGKTIPGFFYDEPETKGDWGTELNVILQEWGIDWKKAYVAYKFKLAGDDQLAARYQYMEAIAEAWGRVMYGGMSTWCRERGVMSIGHFMEHGHLYLQPDYCAGDMMRLQKYSDMGGIDLVVRQMYPGQRPPGIYQTPKLGSSVSHVYGKQDDLAMCEIFGGYNQVLTYPQMKWLTDQHQVRGINFMIPHSFNPKAPHDRDYPPYFYNDGYEPRWPLYRVWADYTSRLSLLLTGGRHVCPIALLFSGNAKRVGDYVTPEDMTTVLQDALYDCDWVPFEAFERATLDGRNVGLHQERYQVLIVPPTEVIPYPTLAKVKAFFDQGGVVLGYGHLPSKSGTIGRKSAQIAELRDAIWGNPRQVGVKACKTNTAGGRSYFLPETPDVNMICAVLHEDAGIPPVVEVRVGETNSWLHALHRVKDGKDIFFITNQHHDGPTKRFDLHVHATGVPESWDAMRGEIRSLCHRRISAEVVNLSLTLEPLESILVVFSPAKRELPDRLEPGFESKVPPIEVKRTLVEVKRPEIATAKEETPLADCCWVWHASDPRAVPPCSRYFRGTVEVPHNPAINDASIRLTADNDFVLYVNGKKAGAGCGDWRRIRRIDLKPHLKGGRNTLAIKATNSGTEPNPAGVIGGYTIVLDDDTKIVGRVDKSWTSSTSESTNWNTPAFDDVSWSPVKEIASYGSGPWRSFADRSDVRTLPAVAEADPFLGQVTVPRDWLGNGLCVCLETDDIPHEPAAAVAINGQYVGGFIGKPFRLDVTKRLKPGNNTVEVAPFAPTSMRLVLYATENTRNARHGKDRHRRVDYERPQHDVPGGASNE